MHKPTGQEHGDLLLALSAVAAATTRYDWESQTVGRVSDATILQAVACFDVLSRKVIAWAESENLNVRGLT